METKTVRGAQTTAAQQTHPVYVPHGLTRRQAVGGAAVLAAVCAAAPLGALATDAPADTAGAAEGAASAEAATLLNDVTYPEPIASQDYEAQMAVDEDNPLDEGFLAGLETFSSNLTCYGLAGDTADGEAVPNGCLSPVSLYLALALLAQGAQGDTQTQILDVLGTADSEELASQCSNLMRVLWARTTPEGDPAPSILKVANSVWMLRDVPFEQTFLDQAAEQFYAECYEVAAADEAAGQAMGSWVADHTGGTLDPVFNLGDDWIAGLLNTVWFEGAWSDPFNENDTASGTFHAAAGDVKCDFMTTARTCTVASSAGCRVASLPLANGASVTFVLPDEGVDPRSFFARATGVGKLWALEGTSGELAEVTFTVPKVSFDTQAQLVDVCRQMGVGDVFDVDAADLGALTSASAFVSQVQQGTHFAMDEKGVEASAYTYMGIEASSALEELEQVEFRLDRPFAFRLSGPQGVALFVGIVGDPTQG